MDGRGAALVLFLLLAFAWRCSAQFQCFRMQNCVGLLQTDLTARECCLSDDGAFFETTDVIEQCRACLLFGWKRSDAMEPLPDMIEVTKGQVVDLTIGYIKGIPDRPRPFEIQSPPGVTVSPQGITLRINDMTVQVEVLDDGQPVTEDRNFILTLEQDQTLQENEFLFGTANLFLPGTRCPALVNPSNGMVMLTGDRPGDNATYTCDAGFVLVGDAMLTCQDDGMWSAVPPTCQEIVLVVVSLDSVETTGSEEEGAVSVCVTATDATSTTFSVSLTAIPGTAEAEDFVFDPRSLELNATQSTECVDVGIVRDGIYEIPENFSIELSAPADVVVAIGTTVINILDSDKAAVMVEPGSEMIKEGDTRQRMVCLQLGNSSIPVAVSSTVDSSSTSDTGDVMFDSMQLILEPDSDPACLTYSVNDDEEVERTETLLLVWSTVQPRVIFEPDTFILIIEDNDEPPSPTPPPDSVLDVVSGDPMFTVPINARSDNFTPGSVSLCYEIHGEDGQFFNLISDSCLSVNAHYSRPHLSIPVNVMDQIAVVATNNDGENVNISINHQCRAQVNGIDLAYFNSSGVVLAVVGPSQVIVTAGNCNDEAVVMSVTCERSDIGNGDNTLITDMLRFSVYRGLALRESSHGLLGQFWNIPINVSHFTEDLYLVSIGNRDNQPTRQFIGSLYNFTWQLEKKECLYVGDRQGAKEAGFHGGPNDAVIEGVYSSYKVDGPFETYFEFSQFGK